MKIKLPLFILLIISFLSVNDLHAQDPVFSQFYASPLQTNPALTGVFNGKFRLTANYKQQWNSILQTNPFRTIAAGFDMRSAVGRDDFFSYGVSALKDEAGVGNFNRNVGAVNFSYMKAIGGRGYRSADQYLIAGAMVGAGQFGVDADNLWFSTQFDTGTETINQGLASQEVINANSDVYIDINAGLMWYGVFDDNQSLYIGGAVFHANAPQFSFIDDGQETLDFRWMVQAGGELPFNDNFSVLPGIIVTSQGESLLSIAGANFRYTNRDWREIAIRAGAFVHVSRQADAVTDPLGVTPVSTGLGIPTYTISAILEMERINIGISYDIATNRLEAPTNNRGGYELSVSYIHPGTRKEKVKCPKL